VRTYTPEEQLRADMWNVAWQAINWHRAWQNVGELAEILYRLADEDPPVKTVVEIGAAWGGTLYAWRQLPAVPAVYAVTLTHYADLGSMVHGATVLTGDSHDRVTVQRLKDQLGGRPVDALFIDGDHTYEGVRRDWEMYAPLVRAGGLTLFHDIVCDGEPGVARFWAELRTEVEAGGEQYTEIIAKAGKPLGFGIVRMAGEQ
jgi:cephalosporin hydroxylase